MTLSKLAAFVLTGITLTVFFGLLIMTAEKFDSDMESMGYNSNVAGPITTLAIWHGIVDHIGLIILIVAIIIGIIWYNMSGGNNVHGGI